MAGVQAGAGQDVNWDIVLSKLYRENYGDDIEIDIITTYDANWEDEDALDDFNPRRCIVRDSAKTPRTASDDLVTGIWAGR